jgi:serine/threonine-protein kinase
VLLFDFVVLPGLVHRGNSRVPDLSFMPLPQAEKAAGKSGLIIRTRSEQFDPSVPRGAILNQDPPSGVVARRGQVISVTVSLGEEKATIPPLRGQDFREAQVTLGRIGLEPGNVARVWSDDVPANRVLASDPGPDSPIPQDKPIHLLMSLGPEPKRYLVPNWVGQRVRDVVQELDRSGVPHNLMGRNAALSGAVVSQDPAPGSLLAGGQSVRLGAGH